MNRLLVIRLPGLFLPLFSIATSIAVLVTLPGTALGDSQRQATGLNPGQTPETAAQDSDMGVDGWLLKKRIIVLSQEIDDELAGRVIAQLLYLDAQAPRHDIFLYINSPGGDITAGMAIYDVMKSLQSDVVTVSIGQSSSMASILLAAGTKGKRLALPNARIMIHQPWGGAIGQAADIEISAREILYQRKQLNQIMANLTAQPLKRIERDTDRDFFMSAQEAQTYGIVDKVVSVSPSSQP